MRMEQDAALEFAKMLRISRANLNAKSGYLLAGLLLRVVLIV